MIDVRPMWDFGDPEGSERRFTEALATASDDDAIVLEAQIARTHGLRRDFDRARAVLAGLEPTLATAGPRARATYWLELGRTWSSATHRPHTQTDEARETARAAFRRCIDEARPAGEDDLVVDAVHMLAFVDPAPQDQLAWADVGLAVALASRQPAARRWETSLRNNRGVALGRLGRHDEALVEYERALELLADSDDRPRVRVARWMVASALRALGALEAAKDIQLELEAEWDAVHRPDPYVFEELEAIFTAQGDTERAAHYAARRAATRG